MPPRSTKIAKVALVVAVALGLVAAHRAGVLDQVGDPERLTRTLAELGPWGWAAFVLAYAALQPFGVPGTVFILAAPLIWPWPVAFALSMTGTMAASVVGFSFSRFVAREWVAARIPTRFRKYDETLARRAFATVLVLRFVFWMPPLLHAFFGVSKVRFWTHFWASLLGYLVPLFLVSFFGQRIFEVLRDAPPALWAAVAGAAVTVAILVWAARRRRAARPSAAR